MALAQSPECAKIKNHPLLQTATREWKSVVPLEHLQNPTERGENTRHESKAETRSAGIIIIEDLSDATNPLWSPPPRCVY